MKFKILLIVVSFFMISPVKSDQSEPNQSKFIKIETLTGAEAEVIRLAVERFRAEDLNIPVHGYELTVYLKNDEYIVLFEKAKNAPLGTINPGYEVVISADDLKVTHTQFSR